MSSRLHCCLLPGNRGQVFIWQNSPACLVRSGWKNRDLGNGASLPSHMNTSEILDLDWTLVKRHLDGKLISFCLNTNYPPYSDLFCFHRRIANHEKMAAALKRLRDSLELQQFIQDAEDVCCVNCLLFVINFS